MFLIDSGSAATLIPLGLDMKARKEIDETSLFLGKVTTSLKILLPFQSSQLHISFSKQQIHDEILKY